MKKVTKILVCMFVCILVSGISLLAQEEGPDFKKLVRFQGNVLPESEVNNANVGDYIKVDQTPPTPVKDPFTFKEYTREVYTLQRVVQSYLPRKVMKEEQTIKIPADIRPEKKPELSPEKVYVVNEVDKKITITQTEKGGLFLVNQKKDEKVKTTRTVTDYWEYKQKQSEGKSN